MERARSTHQNRGNHAQRVLAAVRIHLGRHRQHREAVDVAGDERGGDGEEVHLFAAQQVLGGVVLLLLRDKSKVDSDEGWKGRG